MFTSRLNLVEQYGHEGKYGMQRSEKSFFANKEISLNLFKYFGSCSVHLRLVANIVSTAMVFYLILRCLRSNDSVNRKEANTKQTANNL
jgi:hypothetical protein